MFSRGLTTPRQPERFWWHEARAQLSANADKARGLIAQLRFLVDKPARLAKSDLGFIEHVGDCVGMGRLGFRAIVIIIDLYDGCLLWHSKHQNSISSQPSRPMESAPRVYI